MKISAIQLQQLYQIALASCKYSWPIDLCFDQESRKKIVNDILQQQSEELEEIK